MAGKRVRGYKLKYRTGAYALLRALLEAEEGTTLLPPSILFSALPLVLRCRISPVGGA